MREHQRGEEGIALMMTMMIIFVATVLAVAALGLANHSLSASGLDRNRTQSVAAAEAGLDNAVYLLQQAGGTLPCTIPSDTLPTSPGTANYSVTISYYSTNPPTGSPMACPLSSVPASAEIVSKAYIGSATATGRAMEALITLTPREGLGDAIYGYNLISLSNNSTMYSSPGSTAPNADLYTNGNFNCSNNETIYGSVYAQGSILAQNGNTCSVTGSYKAVGSVYLDGQMSVGKDVVSSGSTVYLKNVTVGGSVYAAGTATERNTSVSGSTSQNGSTPSVPTQSFPQYTYDSSWFQNNGWATVPAADCSSSPTDTNSVYYIASHMSSATANTVVITNCSSPISWSSTSFTLAKDLTIFSPSGFVTSQKVAVDSTSSGATHNLELIVPYGTTCNSASGYGLVNFSQQTAFGNGQTPDDIDTFIYSPCDVTLQNNQGITGQVYSDGTVTITNKWTMTLAEMPLYGTIANATPLSYIAEYDYKREVPYSS